jgi:hypothetical protein
MVNFKASELPERNYKVGDKIFLEFEIKSLRMSTDDELWLHSEVNNNNVWLKQENIVYGVPYRYRDGDIVTYNGKQGKIVSGFNDDWYVLTLDGHMFSLNPALINSLDGHMFDLNPELINSVTKENNVL